MTADRTVEPANSGSKRAHCASPETGHQLHLSRLISATTMAPPHPAASTSGSTTKPVVSHQSVFHQPIAPDPLSINSSSVTLAEVDVASCSTRAFNSPHRALIATDTVTEPRRDAISRTPKLSQNHPPATSIRSGQ